MESNVINVSIKLHFGDADTSFENCKITFPKEEPISI